MTSNHNSLPSVASAPRKPVKVSTVLVYAGLILWALICLFPVSWMLTSR